MHYSLIYICFRPSPMYFNTIEISPRSVNDQGRAGYAPINKNHQPQLTHSPCLQILYHILPWHNKAKTAICQKSVSHLLVMGGGCCGKRAVHHFISVQQPHWDGLLRATYSPDHQMRRTKKPMCLINRRNI